MAFIGNHTGNDQLGQSLLSGCSAPWDSLRPSHGGGLRALLDTDTTAIDTHCSKDIHASQGDGVLAVALPPSHSDPRKARHDGEAAVPLPDDGLQAHVDEEQTGGLAGGTALETADESAAF